MIAFMFVHIGCIIAFMIVQIGCMIAFMFFHIGCMIAFIDRLPVAERTSVKIASIIGASFDNAVISHLMPGAPANKVVNDSVPVLILSHNHIF